MHVKHNDCSIYLNRQYVNLQDRQWHVTSKHKSTRLPGHSLQTHFRTLSLLFVGGVVVEEVDLGCGGSLESSSESSESSESSSSDALHIFIVWQHLSFPDILRFAFLQNRRLRLLYNDFLHLSIFFVTVATSRRKSSMQSRKVG